jgi:hypothetical protein
MGALIIPSNIMNEISYCIQRLDTEISWMGRIVVTPQNDYLVTHIYLLSQEVGAAHTDIDAEAVARIMYESIADEGDLLYWVHSHANMGAFWSGVDVDTIKTMGRNGLCVASVFNKKGESRHASCYVAQSPYHRSPDLIYNDNIAHTVGLPPSLEETTQWDTQLAAKIRQKPVAAYAYQNYYGEAYSPPAARNWEAPQSYRKGGKEPEDEGIGLLGYGDRIEAQVLGMKLKDFRNIVYGNDTQARLDLGDRLEMVYNNGSFTRFDARGGPSAY